MIGDNLAKNNHAFSLLELLVAVGIFMMMILAATSIFQQVVRSQSYAIAGQNVQESMRFVLEMVSKEIRSAKISNDSCVLGAVPNKVYNYYLDVSDGWTLVFKNRHNECVFYYVSAGRLMVERTPSPAMPITPDEIIIANFEASSVFIDDDLIGAFHSTQPSLTLKMDVEMDTPKEVDKQKMTIQTSISSRYYE